VHDSGDVLVLLDVFIELDALDEGRGAVTDSGDSDLDDRLLRLRTI